MTRESYFSIMGLTPRQVEVAFLVTEGFSNKEIAEMLGVKEKCVKFHLCRVFIKLGVKGRGLLIVNAWKAVTTQQTAPY